MKDIFDTADMPTENGSVLYAGRTPSRDATVVAMFRAAGAVIMGKTVTTEFAYFFPGKTRNPHNAEHTPGGSSSGSAAAVAAGMVPHRDRQPDQRFDDSSRGLSAASVGFKPTHGLIPRHGVLALSRTLDHVGLFARTLDDIALLTEQLGRLRRTRSRHPAAGAHSVCRTVAAEEPPMAPMLAFVKTPCWDRVDDETREGFAELVEQLGEQVEEVELFPSAGQRVGVASDDHGAPRWRSISSANGTRGGTVCRSSCGRQLERGRQVRAVDYQRALADRAGITKVSLSFSSSATTPS